MALPPRTVAVRELDGIPFEVMVLREAPGGVYVVAYLDDGNIERSVPSVELDASAIGGSGMHRVNLDVLFEDASRRLEQEDAELAIDLASGTVTPQGFAGTSGRLIEDDAAAARERAAPAPSAGSVRVAAAAALTRLQVAPSPRAVCRHACEPRARWPLLGRLIFGSQQACLFPGDVLPKFG